MEHYHITGLMADDEGLPAYTLREVTWEAISRARMEEDHRASSAYALGDERDDYSPGMEDRAAAWDEIRIADQYKQIADDLSRFDRYLAIDAEGLRMEEWRDREDGESPQILPPIYFHESGGYRLSDDGKTPISLRLSIERAARVALGIEPGWRIGGHEKYRDLGEIEIYSCPSEIGWDEDGIAWDRDLGDEEDLLPYPPDADPRVMADLGLDADGKIIEIEDPPDQNPLVELSANLGERDDLAPGSFLGDHVEIIPVRFPKSSDEGDQG